MKQILTVFSILTSLFFIAPAIADEITMPEGDFVQMSNAGYAIVTEVVNPLTVKLEDGRFIHLAGLDFPDLDFYEPGALSVTTQQILDDFLKGKKVTIYQTKSADKGRINRMNHHIAHLVRTDKNIWVQGMLLSLGVTRTRTSLYNPEMADQMLALEEKSRTNKLGMWDIDEFKILSPKNAEKHIGSYQIVEGRVNNASMHKNKLYLNFGNNWREDFTIAISAFDLRRFTKKQIDPQKWNGKTIRVRGWIESYNGPYMEIDHPERFEAIFEQKSHKTAEETKSSALPTKPSNHNKKPPRKKDKGSALPVFND